MYVLRKFRQNQKIMRKPSLMGQKGKKYIVKVLNIYVKQ